MLPAALRTSCPQPAVHASTNGITHFRGLVFNVVGVAGIRQEDESLAQDDDEIEYRRLFAEPRLRRSGSAGRYKRAGRF